MSTFGVYSPERHLLLVRAANEPISLKLVASAAGITYGTLSEWIARGRQGVEPYRQLADDINQAQARAWRKHLKRINRASRKDWKASAWVLEHAMPDEFGSERKLIAEQSHTIEQQRNQITELLAAQQRIIALLPEDIQTILLAELEPRMIQAPPQEDDDDSE